MARTEHVTDSRQGEGREPKHGPGDPAGASEKPPEAMSCEDLSRRAADLAEQWAALEHQLDDTSKLRFRAHRQIEGQIEYIRGLRAGIEESMILMGC
jgi:hypothetical protein